ncbi:MAG: PASTA domain-containing protein [Candidatus Omnitrophica bacterium]|nr:PASTA domain-containing protein [Candidatus Omnitrophota bacterium]
MQFYRNYRFISYLVISSILTIVMSTSAFARHSQASFNVFTKTYTRDNGKPKAIIDTFTVLNPQTKWQIKVSVVENAHDKKHHKNKHDKDWKHDDDNDVNFVIYLNGRKILKSERCDRHSRAIEETVNLKSHNTLSVELRGKPNSKIVVQISGVDSNRPIINWVKPLSGQSFNNANIATQLKLEEDISGLDPASLQILLDNVSVRNSFQPLAQATLSANLSATLPMTDGQHTLTATIKNLAGLIETKSVSFTVTGIDPNLKDQDNDGYTPNTGDCNDHNFDIHPNSVEIPGNNIDEDCDGVDSVVVVNVVGLFQLGAESAINAANLQLGDVTSDHSQTVAIGKVITQNPAAGEIVPKGTAVGLMISLGPLVDTNIPPDPATVAPAINKSGLTNFFEATSFLYSGEKPIQTGVQPNVINPVRTAVLRGKILTKDGTPLSGVKVSILKQPELGETLSRADGMFDLVVNGGGDLVVTYSKEGLLPSSRQIQVPWQDYVTLPDIVMIPSDTQVTSVDLTSNADFQVAQGSTVSDQNGQRQGTLLIPQGTQASLIISGQDNQPIDNLQIRITEYTVGPLGPLAMPAELPATSAYTYAFDVNADEALAAGASEVVFSQPLIYYVDNFLNFPAGIGTPLGFYDEKKGQWIPYDNGLVIKILGIQNNIAQLDIDGSGQAASEEDLAKVGITFAERQKLASLYSAGKSVWRVLIPHFSSWDINMGVGPPEDAIAALVAIIAAYAVSIEEPDCVNGSIIECQTQVLGESVDVNNTPFTLNYRSDRAAGHKASFSTKINVSQGPLPESLKRIVLETSIAGQKFHQEFAPQSNLTVPFTWNGKDVYGRVLHEPQVVNFRVGYVYDGVYQVAPRFGYNGNGMIIESNYPGTGSGLKMRQEITIWQSTSHVLGVLDARQQRLGGWTLNAHHVYDPISQTLYYGDGSKKQGVKGQVGKNNIVSTVMQGDLYSLVDVGPDGSIYTVEGSGIEYGDVVIRRSYPNGTSKIVAGGGSSAVGNGDGGPATSAKIKILSLGGLAVASDGTIYIGEFLDGSGQGRVRRITSDGIITTYAGGGDPQSGVGDGDLATQASLSNVRGLAVGPDGSLFISDYGHAAVRKVDTDGIISSIAGAVGPIDIDVAQDGSVYFSDLLAPHNIPRIWRVLTSGTLEKVAAADCESTDANCYRFENKEAALGLTIASDQAIYFASTGATAYSNYIYRLSQGVLTSIAGSDLRDNTVREGISTQVGIFPVNLAFSPDGSLYFANSSISLQRITSTLPGFKINNIEVASDDGSELYVFDSAGHHLKTVSTLTGLPLYQFGYTANGLSTITDRDGNITQIERTSNGDVSAIVSPYGQRTTLHVGANGYLDKVIEPNGDTHQFVTSSEGLLAQFINPRNNTSKFTYDTLGQLTRDENPEGVLYDLSRKAIADGYEVTLKDALNRASLYQSEYFENGEERRLITLPDGTQSSMLIRPDYSVSSTYADGTSVDLVRAADARFGIQSPLILSQTVRTPGGLTSTLSTTRVTNLANPIDLLSVINQSETLNINGKVYSVYYDIASKTKSVISPEGRFRVANFDNREHVVKEQSGVFEPVNYTYDARGRLIQSTQGSGAEKRTLNLTYNADGFLSDVTNSLNEKVSYTYDIKGRVLKQTLPDGRFVEYTYDANDNLTSITPPGQPKHNFVYSLVDLVDQYNPPVIVGGGQTTFLYNRAKQLTTVTRPDGQLITYDYNPAGRLSVMTTPRGQTTYSYNPASGYINTVTAPDGGSLTYTYDGSLLLSKTWGGTIHGSVSQSYDNDFRIVSQSVNGGSTVNFAYDNDGLLTQAGLMSMSRNPTSGFLVGTTLGNFATTFGYNNFGELGNDAAKYNGTNYLEHQYTYDTVGRIVTRSETDQNKTDQYRYTYNSAGRLTDVTKNNVVVSHYEYDANGNRLSRSSSGTTESATYDAQDRLLTYGSLSYTYTANGELKSKTDSSTNQTTQYKYDVLGNLMQVTLPDGKVIDYVIDANNRRIGKKVNGTLVQGFLYEDDLSPAVELDGNNNIVSRFVYGTRGNVPDYMQKAGKTYKIVTDHLGSMRMVVDTSNGSIAQRIDYDEFGRVLTDTNVGFQPFGFAGGLYESATGLTRFGARDYDAFTGRWTAKDPIGFGGGDTNLYGYVHADPVNWVDQDGLAIVSIGKLKKALKKVHDIVGKLPKGKPGKKGSPQRGDSKKGYRLDKESHPNAKAGSPESKGAHLNYWDYTEGKRKSGQGLSGAITLSTLGPILLDLLDPFDAEALDDEDADLDGNGIPDWQDMYESCENGTKQSISWEEF